jgi:hypothetical protein
MVRQYGVIIRKFRNATLAPELLQVRQKERLK